jgi:hypothetical protein
MNLDEFEKKAYKWSRTVEDILIEIAQMKDAKGLMFVVDATQVVKSFDLLMDDARGVIKRSELKLEDDT